MKKTLLLSLFLSLVALLQADPLPVIVGPSGRLTIGPDCTLTPSAYGKGWTVPNRETDAEGNTILSLASAGNVRVSCNVTQAEANTVHVQYTFHSEAAGPIEQIFVNVDLPSARLATGGKWTLPSQSGSFPTTCSDHHIAFDPNASTLGLIWPTRALSFAFDSPTAVSVLDCRMWGDSFVCRLAAQVPQKTLEADTPYTVAFTLSAPSGLVPEKDGPVTISANSEWIPLPSSKDVLPDSALDFSALYPWHAPAGTKGHLLAKGPHFVFENEPDTPVRFYGANLCFSANFNTPDEAETLATRFRRIGYNTVRIHHYDKFITEGIADRASLNPDHMALLDNTLAAFIRHGVYITTDLFVSRPIPWRSIGVDRDGLCPCDEFKARCAVSKEALNHWKAFVRAFLTHVNPHTGRAYADEPALAFLCLVNEGNLGNSIDHQRNIPEYITLWKQWLAKQRSLAPDIYSSIPETIPDQLWNSSPHGIAYLQFLDELEGTMVERMKDFIHNELHCKALLTDSNGWINRTTSVRFRAKTLDYADDHFYFDHPKFLERSWCLPSYASNIDPLFDARRGVPTCAYSRIFGKPFAVSEYNFAVPSRHRAIGGMIFGTLAALQDWSVLWRFAYSHSHEALFNDHHLEFFDISLDDGMLAADRIALCLFLRGDRSPLFRSIAIEVPATATPEDVTGPAWALTPLWASTAWTSQIGYSVKGEASTYPTTPEVQTIPAGVSDPKAWPAPATMPLGDPTSRCMIFPEDDNVAAAVSLDAAPIASSRHLLVTHIPEIQDANTTFSDRARTTLSAFGTLPHLVNVTQRTLTLPLSNPQGFVVYPLRPDGSRLAPIPTSTSPDGLSFVLDSSRATLYYEIIEP